MIWDTAVAYTPGGISSAESDCVGESDERRLMALVLDVSLHIDTLAVWSALWRR